MAYIDGAFSARPFISRLTVNQGAQSIEGNFTTVSWTLEIIKVGNSTPWNNTPSNWYVTINGAQYSGPFTYDFRNTPINGGVTLAGTAQNIYHAPDGTAAFNFSSGVVDSAGSAGLGTASASGSMGLTTIPRASNPSLSASTFDAGSAITITTNRVSPSFTHIVEYYFGSQGVQIATGVTDSISWTPPLSLLNEIPNSTSGTGFIRVHTYSSDGTGIGYRDVPMTITAGAAIVPTFTTVTHAESNTLVSTTVGAYVQNLTQLTLNLTGSAGVYGSTITSRKITVAGQTINAASGTTPAPVNLSGTVPIVGTVTDSRGRTTSKTVNVTFLPWVPPAITTATVQRALVSGVANDNGTYLRVNINAAVQSLVNGTQKNVLVYRVYTRLRGASTWTLKSTQTPGGIAFNSYNTVGTYPIESAYEVRVEVSDRFATSAVQLTVATASIFMHWDSSNGVGIGKYRQSGQLDVLGQIYQNDGKAVLDTSYVPPAQPSASETVKGIVELATAAEATTGTDNTRAITPSALANMTRLPFAMAAGAGSNTAGTWMTVTFPTGRFTQPPIVTGGSDSRTTAQPVVVNVGSLSTTSMMIAGFAGNSAVASTWFWQAIQMTPTSGAG